MPPLRDTVRPFGLSATLMAGAFQQDCIEELSLGAWLLRGVPHGHVSNGTCIRFGSPCLYPWRQQLKPWPHRRRAECTTASRHGRLHLIAAAPRAATASETAWAVREEAKLDKMQARRINRLDCFRCKETWTAKGKHSKEEAGRSHKRSLPFLPLSEGPDFGLFDFSYIAGYEDELLNWLKPNQRNDKEWTSEPGRRPPGSETSEQWRVSRHARSDTKKGHLRASPSRRSADGDSGPTMPASTRLHFSSLWSRGPLSPTSLATLKTDPSTSFLPPVPDRGPADCGILPSAT